MSNCDFANFSWAYWRRYVGKKGRICRVAVEGPDIAEEISSELVKGVVRSSNLLSNLAEQNKGP